MSKNYILIDDDNFVRCVASHESNLHEDKLHMRKYYVEDPGFGYGDEYNPVTGEHIRHPESYPGLNAEELAEQKIAKKMRKNAIKDLKKDGELPPDYPEE